MKFPYGKYKGRLVSDIIKSDYVYVDWWDCNVTNHPLTPELSEQLLKQINKEIAEDNQRQFKKAAYDAHVKEVLSWENPEYTKRWDRGSSDSLPVVVYSY